MPRANEVPFILAFGVLFLRLHHLPDHIASKSQKVQYEVVAVLALLAMITHVNAFWIVALLLTSSIFQISAVFLIE